MRSSHSVELKKKIQDQSDCCKELQTKLLTYKCMVNTYWERWRFELDERRQLLNRKKEDKISPCKTNDLSNIDRSLLRDPPSSGSKDIYVGRGSFGIVKFQMYRNIPVAVKEFLPRTCIEDVHKEASILQKLCHPYLPLFFGMCTLMEPYIVVMQYHGIDGKSVTLHEELVYHKYVIPNTCKNWTIICTQATEALAYLHNDLGIIHNDLKANNVLLCHAFNREEHVSPIFDIQIVVIDFGKATQKDSGRIYRLTHFELQKYRTRFPHIAPEVVEGKNRESTASDIYAYGMLLKRIVNENDSFSDSKLRDISEKCLSKKSSDRPSAPSVLKMFKDILKTFP